VTVKGVGFTGATAVHFGATAVTSGITVSGTGNQLTVKSPAGLAGTEEVTVTVAGYSSVANTADLFTYYSLVPVVYSLSTLIGSQSGGTSVTITGGGFTGATAVTFGTVSAAKFTVNSATSITAVTKAGKPTAVVNVRVTGPSGTSAVSWGDIFTFGPFVSSVSPSSGGPSGGTLVTITGAGFTGATAVHFGATTVTSGITVSATGDQLTVKAPAGSAGTVNLTVTVGGYTSLASTSGQFTYT
jgi:hypothetical protein